MKRHFMWEEMNSVLFLTMDVLVFKCSDDFGHLFVQVRGNWHH